MTHNQQKNQSIHPEGEDLTESAGKDLQITVRAMLRTHRNSRTNPMEQPAMRTIGKSRTLRGKR